jgi:hypothetical protein
VDATGPSVVCTDSAGATHQFTDELREAHINVVIGYDLTAPVRGAILTLPNRRGHRRSARTAPHASGRERTRSLTAWIWAAS